MTPNLLLPPPPPPPPNPPLTLDTKVCSVSMNGASGICHVTCLVDLIGCSGIEKLMQCQHNPVRPDSPPLEEWLETPGQPRNVGITSLAHDPTKEAWANLDGLSHTRSRNQFSKIGLMMTYYLTPLCCCHVDACLKHQSSAVSSKPWVAVTQKLTTASALCIVLIKLITQLTSVQVNWLKIGQCAPVILLTVLCNTTPSPHTHGNTFRC